MHNIAEIASSSKSRIPITTSSGNLQKLKTFLLNGRCRCTKKHEQCYEISTYQRHLAVDSGTAFSLVTDNKSNGAISREALHPKRTILKTHFSTILENCRNHITFHILFKYYHNLSYSIALICNLLHRFHISTCDVE